VTKTCKNCGKIFDTTMPKKQDFCDPNCRTEYQRKERLKRAPIPTADIVYTLQQYGYKCARCGSIENLTVVREVDNNGNTTEFVALCAGCTSRSEKS
jgi:rRNA maturation protein Nop10